LLNNRTKKSLYVEAIFVLIEFFEDGLALFLADHQIVDIQFFHNIVILVLIDILASHAVNAKGLLKLMKLVP
jgi:hypothetical protein